MKAPKSGLKACRCVASAIRADSVYSVNTVFSARSQVLSMTFLNCNIPTAHTAHLQHFNLPTCEAHTLASCDSPDKQCPQPRTISGFQKRRASLWPHQTLAFQFEGWPVRDGSEGRLPEKRWWSLSSFVASLRCKAHTTQFPVCWSRFPSKQF